MTQPTGARLWLDRNRAPLCVALVLIILVGMLAWEARLPRSEIVILAPPAETRAATSQPTTLPVPQTERASAGAPTAAPAPTATQSHPATAGAIVNLNTATADELESLYGIGPVIARRIIDYREQHGSYTRVEQIMEAKLLPRSTFERLRAQLTVEELPESVGNTGK